MLPVSVSESNTIYAPEKIVTPFAVVKAHPNLAAHVQNIGLPRCLMDSYLTLIPDLIDS